MTFLNSIKKWHLLLLLRKLDIIYTIGAVGFIYLCCALVLSEQD